MASGVRGVVVRLTVGAVVGIAMGGGQTALAQSCPDQTQNPTLTTWIELPDGIASGESLGNIAAGDLQHLDVFVNNNEHIRIFYTTEGYFEDVEIGTDVLHSGRLRPVDIVRPIPDLSAASFGFKNQHWSDPQWLPGEEPWFIRSHVAHWTDLFQNPDPDDPLHVKGNALVGFSVLNGWLFVNGPHRNDKDVTPPIGPAGFDVSAWNGITLVNGTGDPEDADVVAAELQSAGTAPLGSGMREAVPEGSLIVSTQPPGGRLSTYLIVANYCGDDAAGILVVQDLAGLPDIDADNRVYVDYYQYLGDWLEGVAPFTDAPTSSLSVWPLGPEVPREYFTCPGGPEAVDCADGLDTIGGNKLRPCVVVKVGPTLPNARRQLLVAGLNLDPIDLVTYDITAKVPMDRAFYQEPVSGHGRDDGKYDYLAITDITDMVADAEATLPLWSFQDVGQWRARTRFLRLPPDVPAGWDYTIGETPINSGHDWSRVLVENPDPEAELTHRDQMLVGSGTIKSLAADPTGEFLYVVSSDQHQEAVIENATLGDGGWHMPHLYKIDLGAGNFTNQAFLNSYAPTIPTWRLPKVIYASFPLETPVPDPPDTIYGYWGSTLVRPTIPGFPGEATGSVWTGPTRVGGATCGEIGAYYPGESQQDPTARTKLTIVRNDNFTSHRVRMYLGTTGQAQTSETGASTAEHLPLPGFHTGAIYSISLGSPGDLSYGEPQYLATLTLWQDTVLGFPEFIKPYLVGGFKVLPTTAEWLGTKLDRNVLIVTAMHVAGLGPAGPIDQLTLIQDQ